MIRCEDLTESLIKECTPILNQNHSETGQFEILDIDWDYYISLGERFIAFVLRDDKTKEIKGVLFFLIGTYPHDKSLVMAQQVTFYVDKKYRTQSLKMIRFSEVYFLGWVDLILQSARVDSDFCKILGRIGYNKEDLTFSRRLQ